MASRPHITENTRKNLIDAFWKLYLIKPMEQISIKEITDLAGYNRGTFYLYFKDIYDALDSIERDTYDVMEAEIEKNVMLLRSRDVEPEVSDIAAAAIEIFKACDYKPLILINDNSQSDFEIRLKEMINRHLFSSFEKRMNVSGNTKEYMMYFFISGVMGVLKKWYNEGMVISVEEHLTEVCNVLFGKESFREKTVQKNTENIERESEI